MNAPWHGVYSAVATPLTADGDAINVPALRALVRTTIEAGIHGLIPCGSTGEFASLSADERMQVVEIVIDEAAGRVPVVPHTGAMSTAEAVRLSQHAQGAGAAGVMAVVPYYEPVTLDEAGDYYRDLSASLDIPIMVYNLPPATGITMTGPWIAELAAAAPNVRYVKDTSGDLSAVLKMLHGHAADFGTFVGWDVLTFAALNEGAPGVVIGAANLVARQLVGVYDAITTGDVPGARAQWDRVWPILDVLVSGPYTAAVKAGMEMVGLEPGPTRRPVGVVAPERAARLRQLLAGIG
ncbi:MAG: dihydrodipicolinate synthase family protein [Chloroflexota bacterium]